jgi:SNF2 family DNA or RNA helicase
MKRARDTAGPGSNPWNVFGKIICSLDFIKSDSFLEDLESARWDAVIFDEAHRLRRDANHSTLAYTMAEVVAGARRPCSSCRPLPSGKAGGALFLIALLDRNVLGPFQSFSQEYCYENADTSALKDKLSEVLIRRTKRDVGGFTKRYARTIKFDLYPDERFLYEETTKYVVEEFNRALQTENRAVGFVMTVFQKLLDSSSYALLMALRNRRKRLQELVDRAESGALILNQAYARIDAEDPDEEPDEDMLDMHLEKTVEELNREIKTISRIIVIAEQIGVNKKGEKLLELIASLKKKGRKKFLIFTQFRTTQDYLKGLLNGYRTAVFNGSMSGDEKEKAILDFKEDGEILICTEAGGEGRNMQFCSILINYDLPCLR